MPTVPSQAPSPIKALIAANLDRAITARGMTNRQVGEAIGKTEHQVWRWRRGKFMPEERTLMALAELLADGRVAAFYEDDFDPVAA